MTEKEYALDTETGQLWLPPSFAVRYQGTFAGPPAPEGLPPWLEDLDDMRTRTSSEHTEERGDWRRAIRGKYAAPEVRDSELVMNAARVITRHYRNAGAQVREALPQPMLHWILGLFRAAPADAITGHIIRRLSRDEAAGAQHPPPRIPAQYTTYVLAALGQTHHTDVRVPDCGYRLGEDILRLALVLTACRCSSYLETLHGESYRAAALPQLVFLLNACAYARAARASNGKHAEYGIAWHHNFSAILRGEVYTEDISEGSDPENPYADPYLR